MKTQVKFLTLLSCAALMLAPAGCDTLKTISNLGSATISQSTADQLIVDAENGAEIGLDSFNTFIHLEKDHRTVYAQISPKIHEFSAWLRFKIADPTESFPPGSEHLQHFIPRGEALLKSVRKATQEFKANRTPANEAGLRAAWATLKSAIDDCKRYTSLATFGQP